MHFSLVDYLLWLPSPILQVGVLVALFRRGLHKEYPYFFKYTILQVLVAVFLLCVQGSEYLYYYGYWVISAISIVISSAMLYEIFKHAFCPYEALRNFSVVLLRWSALVLLVGGMWAIHTARTDQPDFINAVILRADGSLRLMQCALAFFLLLFSKYLGISRRHMLFGIALGFGLFASVSMLVATGMSHSGLSGWVLRRINCAAYDVAALIWLGYTALPSRTTVLVAIRPQEWNSALEGAYLSRIARSLLTIKFRGQ